MITNNIYGTIPPPTERVVESFEALLERYPWFDTARRLTQKQSARLPAHILLVNYFRPPQTIFKATAPKSEPSDTERIAAEAIARRESERARRADADEADFPTVGGISAILGGDVEQSTGADDIIAAFVAGGEHRIEFCQPEQVAPVVDTPVADDAASREIAAFLALGDFRIDPDESAPSPPKERLEGAVDLSDGNFASEELGAIYLKQNLLDEAREIYSQLSLQNPEKSGYFATLIADASSRVEAREEERKKGLKRG